MSSDTWVEISGNALSENLKGFRNHISSSNLMFVVKANAYGHGLTECIKISESLPGVVEAYGVHDIEDAVLMREMGVTRDIYVLGYVKLSQLDLVFKYSLIPVITNVETAEALSQRARAEEKKLSLCIKCETGTFRQGIGLEQVGLYASIIKGNSLIELKGLSTHFANIEDTTDHKYAEMQLNRFKEFLAAFSRQGIDPPVNHIACSAAIMLFPETHYQLVRLGISAYGLWPSKSTYVSANASSAPPVPLRPALSWKTFIGHIKEVAPRSPIGYGCTYKTTTASKLAILPVGYYDGYDRKLSNVGYVLIRGRRAPIRGRICMNMTIVDITHIPDASLEDEVVLIGRSGDETISAETLAEMVGTINYEIVSRINPLIPRYIVT